MTMTGTRLEDRIAKLEEVRNPLPEPDEDLVNFSVKVPRATADWLRTLAKELEVRPNVLARDCLEEGVSKLQKAESKLPGTG